MPLTLVAKIVRKVYVLHYVIDNLAGTTLQNAVDALQIVTEFFSFL